MGNASRHRGVRGAGSRPTLRSDGRWEAKLDLGIVDGKRRRKTFYGKTRKEAQEKLARALYEYRRGLPVPDERVTVRQFFEQSYLPQAQRLEPATYRIYEQMARIHLVPALGHLSLAKLTVQQVQAFLDGKSDRGYAPRSVEIMRAVLRQALGLAETWGLVSRNVAKLVKVHHAARRPSGERRFLSVAEAERLFAAARGQRLEALYTVALMLGLRQGEALALRWRDVDLAARVLRVDEAVQRVKGEGLRFKDTKTHQSRTIPLPASCAAALGEHRRRQEVERELAGERWREYDLIFCTRHGTPLDGTNVSRYFKSLLQRAGIPDMRYYDLRHSAASLMAARGVPARVAMEILGHSDIRLTMNVYTHVLDEAKRRAADAMDELFPPVEETNDP